MSWVGLQSQGSSHPCLHVCSLERQTGSRWQPVTIKQFTPQTLQQGKQELQGLLVAQGLPHIIQLVEAFTVEDGAATGTSLVIITE